MLVLTLTVGMLLCGRYGLALLLECLVYALALRKGVQTLGGMNGDISGYALTLSEMAAVAAYALL